MILQLPQNFLVDPGVDHQALGEQKQGHNVPIAGDYPKEPDREERVGVPYDRDLFNVPADSSVVLLVASFFLIEGLFIREDPGYSVGPLFELNERICCLDFSRLFEGPYDAHGVRLAIGGVTNILLDPSLDQPFVIAHFNSDIRKDLGFITVDGLLDGMGVTSSSVLTAKGRTALALCSAVNDSLFSNAVHSLHMFMTMVLLTPSQN